MSDFAPYRGLKTCIVGDVALTESIGIDTFDDIPVSPTDGRFEDLVGRYVFAKYPLTTAQVLAVAVLKGEPCGDELVDCLMEAGVIDPLHEAFLIARRGERAYVADKLRDRGYQQEAKFVEGLQD